MKNISWNYLEKKTIFQMLYNREIFFIGKKYFYRHYDSVRIWNLDHKEGWVPKNWCFWTVMLEKTLESPFECKEIRPVNPKGNQPWIFIGKTVAEAPILWPAEAKSWLIRKDPEAGKDGRREEMGVHQRTRWLDVLTNSMDMSLSKLQKMKDRKIWSAAVHGVTKSWTQLIKWTTTNDSYGTHS